MTGGLKRKDMAHNLRHICTIHISKLSSHSPGSYTQKKMREIETEREFTTMLMKTAWIVLCISSLLLLLLFCFPCPESTEFLTLQESPSSSDQVTPLAVSVANQDLDEISTSVLMAENWLKTHVLAHYPSSKITHIVVGHNLLCFSQTHQKFPLILPALHNLHHSLTRWGLEREIKVSPSLSSHCFNPSFSHSVTEPLLSFIHGKNSTYLVNPVLGEELETLAYSHLKSLKKLGFLPPGKFNLVVETPDEPKPTIRKLQFVIPPRPTPLPEDISPVQNFPFAKSPLPPLIGVVPGPVSSPPSPFGFPDMGLSPAQSPHHQPHLLPPCNPWAGMVPAPVPVAGEKVWCVAKPSVPAATLQEAVDYACGEGGAECDEIQPNGNCYFPDSLVAHASFAFNSYWQKTKNNGGTCSFGGTAMLINSDPSFMQCRFSVR